MLLRHTPKEITERKALTVNPAKTCQPIGAMYASLGIHGCLPHSHGSQGCYAYQRSTLSRHYKEPVMAATSSFTEGASVFGGQANLLQAMQNIFTIYEPEVIAVHTTCLSETIGDDIPQIFGKLEAEGKLPKGKYLLHANTPSYVGSHVTGFANMVKAMALYMSTRLATRIRCERLPALCETVAAAAGRTIPVDKPIVGPDVFSHESGIHCHALRRDANAYQPFLPETIGRPKMKFVDGKHSGRRFETDSNDISPDGICTKTYR